MSKITGKLHRATAPEPPTVVILPTGQAALWCGLLLLVPLVRGKTRLALWGLVTLAGSAATAVVPKSVLPRALLDLSAGLSAENSAPSGHATMATSLALVAVVVCPPAFRYLAASAGVAVAVLTAYFVQTASWHRPSDILMAAAVSLLWAFLAAALVPAAGEDITAERWNLPALSLSRRPPPPCATAVLLALHRFADRPRRAHMAFSRHDGVEGGEEARSLVSTEEPSHGSP
ncbi:phosphatase PAP2 family protein [Streptomyces arboris]|uniref:phosphatase PAP2 family protein n=1 Tax=Streptomyces arboris TaxID=2600619 RepID=UPI003BF504B6